MARDKTSKSTKKTAKKSTSKKVAAIRTKKPNKPPTGKI